MWGRADSAGLLVAFASLSHDQWASITRREFSLCFPDYPSVHSLMSALSLTRQRLTALANADSETDDQQPAGPIARHADSSKELELQHSLPSLSHRMKNDSSILTLALSDDHLFAGTQNGEILVYCLDSYERIAVIEAHKGSVLDLCISQEEGLLFSSAADRITNVWDLTTFERVYSLYSTYDTGDVFCVAYSSRLRTVYLGAQNTAIQWYDLKEKDRRPKPRPDDHPLLREDPFFDSRGPGGIRTPRPANDDVRPKHAKGGQVLEIDKNSIKHFAHYGYVYCMLVASGVMPENAGEEVLISAGGDGSVNIWRLESAQGGGIELIYKLDDGREEGQSILSLALDGSFLYSGRSGGEVNVWDLETRQLVRSIKAHRDDVLSICIGGGYLFSAAVTGYVRVSIVETLYCCYVLTCRRNSIVSISAQADYTPTTARFCALPLHITRAGPCM